MMALSGTRPFTLALLAGLAGAPLACGDSGGGDTASSGATQVTGATTPATTPNEPTTSDSTASEGGGSSPAETGGGTEALSGSTGGSTGGDAPKLDVGVGTTSGGTTGEAEQGCRKVDFLFIIDNSGSMGDEQQNLIQNFPGFIQTIKDKLKLASDYHIMVIDTDAYVFAGCQFMCDFFQFCIGSADDYMCNVTQPEMCEDVLGAGVIHPKGLDSSSMDCGFTSGARYMDISQPDLESTFACAAQVGTGSTEDPEKPMQAMVNAIGPTGMAHDCNAGFLREDAILVVTFITDEDDNQGDGSAGNPDGWKASLVAAKKNDETALVVLGLFGDQDKPNYICPPFDPDAASGAEPSPRLRQFVESFGDRGIAGSVCADSYKEFFEQAVDIIDSTCDDFVPPQ